MSGPNFLHVLGLSPGDLRLPEGGEEILCGAGVVCGGRRLLERFDFLGDAAGGTQAGPEILPIAGPLDKVLDALGAALNAAPGTGRNVVVLADGDPLFFGFGARLVERFGAENIAFHPGLSTVQVAAARMGLDHGGAPVISLHGRDDLFPLWAALSFSGQAFAYTDPRNTPATLGAVMAARGMDGFALTVFEDLGTPGERITRLAPEEAALTEFSPLNLVHVRRTVPPSVALGLGIPDREFQSDGGLITKGPVRAAGLAALRIEPGNTVWDLGSGCGSVAVEASVLARTGPVFAVERVVSRVAMIRENIRRTGAWTVEAVEGGVPGVLRDLPAPHRIFIGGGLGRDAGVLDAACEHLLPGERITAHCILLESLGAVLDGFQARGWEPELTQLSASTGDALGGGTRLKAGNPVFIVSACKPI